MLSRAQALDAAIDAQIGLINQVLTSPKPDYTLDGESYQWAAYLQMLQDKLLTLEQARARADGAWEISETGH